MTTIGDLERKAGIATSTEERTAFWTRFRHLKGEHRLRAGVAELLRLVAEKENATGDTDSTPGAAQSKRERLPPLTVEQHRALQAYAAKHGRRWKSILNIVWMGAAPYDDGGILRGLRNSHGPSWLVAYRLPKPGDLVDPDLEAPDL
ncbi:hypothetical protein [Rhizobium sp. 18055]|uniref:hypothetical protein n=1 Tax=Rhizobium sp. 18055 TaxID=2681403 RepID=UPI00190F8860|nr:hypothetical protein [Rhizobium sp. 18055]